jgi:hypothetical protein
MLATAAATEIAAHFAHSETVVWVSTLPDLYSALFALLALLAYDRFRTTSRVGWYAVCCVAVAAALLTKESSVVLPVLLFATDVLAYPDPRPWRRRLRSAAVRTGPFFAMVVALVAVVVLSGRLERFSSDESLRLFGRHVPRHAIGYLGVVLWPFHVVGEVPGVAGHPGMEWIMRAGFSVARLAAVAGVIWLLLRGTPHQRLLTLWLLLAIAPYLVRTTMFSRYTYLPTAMFALLGAQIVRDALPRRAIAKVGWVVLTMIPLHILLVYLSPSVMEFKQFAEAARPFIAAVIEQRDELRTPSGLWLVDPPEFSYPDARSRNRMLGQILLLIREDDPPVRCLTSAQWQEWSAHAEVPPDVDVYQWSHAGLRRLTPLPQGSG